MHQYKIFMALGCTAHFGFSEQKFWNFRIFFIVFVVEPSSTTVLYVFTAASISLFTDELVLAAVINVDQHVTAGLPLRLWQWEYPARLVSLVLRRQTGPFYSMLSWLSSTNGVPRQRVAVHLCERPDTTLPRAMELFPWTIFLP